MMRDVKHPVNMREYMILVFCADGRWPSYNMPLLLSTSDISCETGTNE
jgi:hypothetical protein